MRGSASYHCLSKTERQSELRGAGLSLGWVELGVCANSKRGFVRACALAFSVDGVLRESILLYCFLHLRGVLVSKEGK